MDFPDRDTRTWPLRWFAIHSLYFLIPFVLIGLVTYGKEAWFFIGIAWLSFSVIWIAWRNSNERISWKWWASLLSVLAITISYATVAMLAGPGDTKICYDRLERLGGTWGRLHNMGPDPYCDGTPVQNVEID